MAHSCRLPSPADQDDLHHRRSRLKIRRTPSSAAPAACSSSFHGSCRQIKGCSRPSQQPVIIQTYDPEVLIIEPAEFMPLVQRLTGSPETQKLLHTSMQKYKEMESSAQPIQCVANMESSVQRDPLKEGQIIILAPAAEKSCSASADRAASKSSPLAASSTYLDRSRYGEGISLEPQLPSSIKQANYGANPFAAPSSTSTEQLNILNADHATNQSPISSISANSANYEETNSAYTSPMSINSPLSPNSSPNTSLERCFSVEEGGASSSSSRDVFGSLEDGNTQLCTEEDGANTDFFVFSGDAYYGSHSHTAAQDELDQLLCTFSAAAVDSFQQVVWPAPPHKPLI